MYHFDPINSYIFNAISALFMSLGLYVVSRSYQGEIKGINHWIIGLFLQTLGWTTTLLSGNRFFIGTGAAFLLFSVVCFFHAIVKFKAEPFSVSWMYGFAFVAYTLNVYFARIHNLPAKIVVVAIAGSILLFANSFVLLAHQKRQTLPVSHKLVGYTFLLSACIVFMRAIYYAFWNTEPITAILHRNTMQDVTFVVFNLFAVVTSYGFVLMCNDKYFTAHKQAQSEHQKTLQRIEKIAQHLPGMIFQYQLNPDGSSCFPYVSSAIQNIFQLNPGDVRESSAKFFEALYPDDRNQVIDIINHSAQHLSLWQSECRIRFKDGTEHWLLTRALPEREADNTTLWHGFLTDITQRKQMEQALEKANHAKQDFVRNMGHELLTPMNGVLGFAQILSVESLTEEQEQYVNLILESGYHLLDLIKEVLDFSNIEAHNAVDLNLEQWNLASLLKSCITLVQSLAAQKSITVCDKLTSDCDVTVLVDGSRLKQVLLNLMANAIKYNHENGSITLSCELVTAQSIKINITDTGAGLSEIQLAKLFQPFERLDATNSAISGVGLGLIISKKVIEAMNGRIGADSAIGEGSHFWIELPVLKADTF